eukprot:662527-Prymnesium_polylepis.1
MVLVTIEHAGSASGAWKMDRTGHTGLHTQPYKGYTDVMRCEKLGIPPEGVCEVSAMQQTTCAPLVVAGVKSWM